LRVFKNGNVTIFGFSKFVTFPFFYVLKAILFPLSTSFWIKYEIFYMKTLDSFFSLCYSFFTNHLRWLARSALAAQRVNKRRKNNEAQISDNPGWARHGPVSRFRRRRRTP
jgi:hypothetical protein